MNIILLYVLLLFVWNVPTLLAVNFDKILSFSGGVGMIMGRLVCSASG